MPTIRRRPTLAANGVIENVLAGSAYEYVGRPSRIQVALARASTAGFVVESDVQVGPELLAESANVSVEPGADQGARIPDYIVVDDMAAAGDRIIVRLRETGGVQSTVSVMVRIEAI